MYLSSSPPAAAGRYMGAWLSGLPSPPSGVVFPASPGQGGPSGQVLGMCTPRSAPRQPTAALFRLYPLDGPQSPRALGHFRVHVCISLLQCLWCRLQTLMQRMRWLMESVMWLMMT